MGLLEKLQSNNIGFIEEVITGSIRILGLKIAQIIE